MDLINWTFNAIDKMFSTKRQASGEPFRQESQENDEDIHNGFMITGFMLFGIG